MTPTPGLLRQNPFSIPRSYKRSKSRPNRLGPIQLFFMLLERGKNLNITTPHSHIVPDAYRGETLFVLFLVCTPGLPSCTSNLAKAPRFLPYALTVTPTPTSLVKHHHSSRPPRWIAFIKVGATIQQPCWAILTITFLVNPFAKRDSHSARSVVWYKILTLASWVLSVVVTVYYTFEAPNDGKYHRDTIWHQNHRHPSGFSLNSLITSIYWFVLPFS